MASRDRYCTEREPENRVAFLNFFRIRKKRESERERDLLTLMPPRDDASPSSLGSSTEAWRGCFEHLVCARQECTQKYFKFTRLAIL